MFHSKDITVVIQGKNEKEKTSKCLESIRKYLPEATIIFSTYENEPVQDLDYDILVESKDPGATLLFGKMYNNTNRILTTTNDGLERVNTKYCIKMRSDLIFDSDKILNNIFQYFPKRDDKYSVFKERVVFYPLWSRKHENIANNYFILTTFHLSDWFCFGLTEDIKNYYINCPFTNEPSYTNYYKIKSNRIQGFYDKNVCWKYPPEQWFCTNFFKKYFKEADMICSQDYSKKRMKKSNQILVNNIIIAGYNELGVYIQKDLYKNISKKTHDFEFMQSDWLNGVFNQIDFMNLYKQYCDPDYIIPIEYCWRDILKLTKYYEKLYKHWRKFKELIDTILEPFSIIYYFLHIIVNIIQFFPRLLLYFYKSKRQYK